MGSDVKRPAPALAPTTRTLAQKRNSFTSEGAPPPGKGATNAPQTTDGVRDDATARAGPSTRSADGYVQAVAHARRVLRPCRAGDWIGCAAGTVDLNCPRPDPFEQARRLVGRSALHLLDRRNLFSLDRTCFLKRVLRHLRRYGHACIESGQDLTQAAPCHVK